MRLHFRQYGSEPGPPLVVLHGLFGSLNNWHSHARAFCERRTVYTIDARNHGASPHDPDATYPAMSADLLEFFYEHHIAAAIVMGHSMGGKTAMRFAADHPERVDALIIVDMAERPYEPVHQEIFAALERVDPGAYASREDVDRELGKTIVKEPVRQFLTANIVRDENGRMQWRMNVAALRACYDQLAGRVDIPRTFTKPILFIRGDRSKFITPEDEREIMTNHPHARIVTVPDAGHWVHADNPAGFRAAVNEVL
jgi:pimeloyl-ACP methyl ester carboxylesterase